MPSGVYVRTAESRATTSAAMLGNQNSLGHQNGLTHGHTSNGQLSPTYLTWYGLKKRCNNPNGDRYKDWGGRGITVCERWQGKVGFANFLADMGERPTGLTLDRIDNDGNYEPGNCRWATPKEQAANRRERKIA